MTRASKLALPILLLVGASCCFASEESPLVFSSFSIEATNGLRSVRLQGRGATMRSLNLVSMRSENTMSLLDNR